MPLAARLNGVVILPLFAVTVTQPQHMECEAHFLPTIIGRQRLVGLDDEVLQGLVPLEMPVLIKVGVWKLVFVGQLPDFGRHAWRAFPATT
jgi:hypothetical protein